MGLVASVWARVLKGLLPRGRAWRLRPDDLFARLLLAAGDEAERIDGRANALQAAIDPRTPGELLEDYERVLGLEATGSDAERIGRVVARLILRQRFRPEDFREALAFMLGFDDPSSVVVLERTAAMALALGDPREIYRFFVYRDPALPGSYDIDGAQIIIDRMKPAHTEGFAIESVDFLCDDEFSLCDRDLLGA